MKIDRLLLGVSKTKGDFSFLEGICKKTQHHDPIWTGLSTSVVFSLRDSLNAAEIGDGGFYFVFVFFSEKSKLTFSFSTKSTKVVLSISTGWPCLSYKASTKWKKLDLRRLDGGCFSKCARASPTPLRAQAQKPAPSTKSSQLKFMFKPLKQHSTHHLCNKSTAAQSSACNRQLFNEIKSELTLIFSSRTHAK